MLSARQVIPFRRDHHTGAPNSAASEEILHILFAGTAAARDAFLDALPRRARVRLLAATCPWDISSLFRSERVDVAILHDSLSRRDFRAFAADIRRRWPKADILIICGAADVIDDPLYDERIPHSSPCDELVAALERLAYKLR